jgi:hemolysin III
MIENIARTRLNERNEVFNAASHFAGFLLSAAGVAVLAALAAKAGKTVHAVSFSIYGATMCFLYMASTLYHFSCIPAGREKRKIFQRLDHCAIYLLIAGTYTPFCVIMLKGNWGRCLLAAVWGLAAAGILLKIVMKNTEHYLSYALYIIMGWLAVVAVVPMVKTMHAAGLSLLFAGGVAYTVGAALLGLKKPRLKPGVFSYHELWHLFVLAGSGFHFALMYFFILPAY